MHGDLCFDVPFAWQMFGQLACLRVDINWMKPPAAGGMSPLNATGLAWNADTSNRQFFVHGSTACGLEGSLRYGKIRALSTQVAGAGDHGVYAMGGSALDIWAVRIAMTRCSRGHKNLCNVMLSGTAFCRREKFESGGTDREAEICRSPMADRLPGPDDRFLAGVGSQAPGGLNYKNRCCFPEENMTVTSMWLVQELQDVRPGTSVIPETHTSLETIMGLLLRLRPSTGRIVCKFLGVSEKLFYSGSVCSGPVCGFFLVLV